MLELPAWKHAEEVAEDEASPALFRRLAALLGSEGASFAPGTAVPVAWSAILFPALAPQDQLGPDGHPRHGDFIPPMPLPKRMFAGRSIEQVQPIRIGDRLTRRSTIADVVEKSGRSGPLIFLTIVHAVTGPDGLCYTERQQVVFREEDSGAAAPRTPEALPKAKWQASFQPDPVMLFRYSALTFNGHRIHYDHPYATGVEGYPALVVNGGLTTLMLLEFARGVLGRAPTRYEVRAMRPLYADSPVALFGAQTETGALFWAADPSGNPAMKITIGTAE